MPEKITLVIDGGIESAAALEWTIARAATKGVVVRLTTIVESDSPQANPHKLVEAAQALGQAAALFAKSASRSKREMVTLRGKAIERLGRALVLVRAWQLPPTVTTEIRGRGTVDMAIHDANSELLRDAASAIARRHGSLSLRQKLSYATPSRALASGAETMELVVVGTHHRHVFAEWMLGSVGHDLVTHLLWPVAIVPPVEGSAASAA